MRLRTKVMLTLAITFGVFVAADLAVQHLIVLPSFVELEREHARRDVERAREAVEREVEHLSLLCNDWAAWDDTCAYVAGEDDEYEDANLCETTLSETDLEIVFICDVEGRPVHGQCVNDSEEQTPLDIPLVAYEAFPQGHPFTLAPHDLEGRAGMVDTAFGPLLFATRPILTSMNEGPSRGTVVMGRFLSEERIARIAAQTHVDVSLHAADGASLPATAQTALGKLLSAPFGVVVDEVSESNLSAVAFLRDIDNQAARILHADVPRDITLRGDMAVRFAVAAISIAGLIALGIIVILLQRIVVGPIALLTEQATEIGMSDDLSQSVALSRRDEIGMLSRELDGMVKRLARSRVALMDAARQSGMADVASGVLHNVGNVLNSLNISTEVLTDAVKRSELKRLDDLVALLDKHENDLPEFVSQEGRAEQLRRFVWEIAEQRRTESGLHLAELSRLQSNLAHVMHIIASQQSMASGHVLTEPVAVQSLLDDAAATIGPALRRHEIELILDAEELPTITVDRVRLLQVLVNLLTNAKDAVKTRARGDRQVTLHASRGTDSAVRFEVADNGKGIDAEALTQIFQQGFTTKEGGSGIGLHFCATAVQNMRGRISAASDGPGHGAKFTIELPAAAARELTTETSRA